MRTHLNFQNTAKSIAILFFIFYFSINSCFAAPGVKITSPHDGDVVRPGDKITVVIEAVDGFVLKEGILILPTDADYQETIIKLPTQITFVLSPGSNMSAYMSVSAKDTSGNFATDEVNLVVQQSSGIQKLVSRPSSILLETEWDGTFHEQAPYKSYFPITVDAIFADGVMREVTKDAATHYESSNPEVVVAERNKIIGLKPGKVTVTITNGAAKTVVPVSIVRPTGLPRSELIPPTTTIHIQPEPNAEGWYNSDITISLTAADNEGGVGVYCIYYEFSNIGKFAQIKGDSAVILLTDEGARDLFYYAQDRDNNTERSSHKTPFKLDKTMPVISITAPANEAEYTLNAKIIASWSALDALSGLKSSSGTVPNGGVIDTASAGQKSFNVTAEDIAGNKAEVQIAYYVRYGFGGFLAPVNPDGSSIFKLGRVIPVKFQLKDAQGNYVSTASARIYLSKVSNEVAGTEIAAESPGEANAGNQFRYDPTNNQYIFNLGTKSLSQGTWQIRIELDDGSSKQVNMSLKG